MSGGRLLGSPRLLAAAVVAAVVCVPLASAAPTNAPTCATVAPSLVKTTLGITVQSTVQSSNSAFSGLKYLLCTYAPTTFIEYISPASGTGWNTLTSQLKHATVLAAASGLGTAAFSGTGTNTSSTFVNGKSKMVTTKTTNLWVYVAGKAIFEISVGNGNLAREKVLALKMVKLV